MITLHMTPAKAWPPAAAMKHTHALYPLHPMVAAKLDMGSVRDAIYLLHVTLPASTTTHYTHTPAACPAKQHAATAGMVCNDWHAARCVAPASALLQRIRQPIVI
jgi:hypothetical protein